MFAFMACGLPDELVSKLEEHASNPRFACTRQRFAPEGCLFHIRGEKCTIRHPMHARLLHVKCKSTVGHPMHALLLHVAQQ